jgi:hypothetical protein
MPINIAALVKEYREVRDALDQERHRYQEFERGAKDKMAQLSMALREVADEMGVDSFRTDEGTAYRVVKESYRVGVWEDVLAWIKETGNWQCLEKRIGKLATKEVHQETGELPPGVEYDAEVEFVVRKS